MQIALITPNVIETLGPGNRLCIWTIGCAKRCFKCMSEELQRFDPESDIDIIAALSTYDFSSMNGVTISGGEPFLQLDELLKLVTYLSGYFADILIYTGLQYEELKENPKAQEIFSKIAVLIDGEYIHTRNRNEKLRGSDNQQIIIFKDEYRESYLNFNKQERAVSYHQIDDKIFGIGLKIK